MTNKMFHCVLAARCTDENAMMEGVLTGLQLAKRAVLER